MSYNISIFGHKQTDSREESEAFEQEIAQKAHEFVASLEGVTAAHANFGTLGFTPLLEQPSVDSAPGEEPVDEEPT